MSGTVWGEWRPGSGRGLVGHWENQDWGVPGKYQSVAHRLQRGREVEWRSHGQSMSVWGSDGSTGDGGLDGGWEGQDWRISAPHGPVVSGRGWEWGVEPRGSRARAVWAGDRQSAGRSLVDK